MFKTVRHASRLQREAKAAAVTLVPKTYWANPQENRPEMVGFPYGDALWTGS